MTQTNHKNRIDFDIVADRYPAIVLKAINLLARFGVIYVDNPRVASASVKLLLDRVYSGADWYDPENVHKNRLLPPFRRDTLDALFATTTPWICSVVRHPERRVLSFYHGKMRTGAFRARINALLSRDANAEVSLDDFVQALTLSPPEEMDPHWRPQSYNLMWDAIDYDCIMRLEDDAPFAPLLDRLGLKAEDVPRRNMARADAPPAGLSAEAIDRIREIYAVDYANFGYD